MPVFEDDQAAPTRAERELLLVVVSVDRFADLFLDERLVRREVVGHHTPDVLDLLVLFVELQLFLEIHLFADERALGVRPHV